MFFRKKKQADVDTSLTESAKIKILGSGCAKCNELERNTREALQQLGREEPIDHVTDFGWIAEYGVMSTPALVVDEKVVSAGRILSAGEIAELLKNAGR